MPASVLTLVRGRRERLANLLLSLGLQTRRPREVVIAWMEAPASEGLPDPGCPVRHLHVPGDPMPLAAARNRAAEAAAGADLIFLDVDCLASPTLVEAYTDALGAEKGLMLGEVFYLPPGALDEGAGGNIPFERLDGLGRPHPAKPPVPAKGLRPEPDACELWGLSFALPRDAYLGLGGMDERFNGYGGEETDFAFRLGLSGLPVFWTGGARAYHQHHAVHTPPLQHFDHILRNARLFRTKHGRWCMDYWLDQFREAGLIEWSPASPVLTALRQPRPDELAASRRPDALFS